MRRAACGFLVLSTAFLGMARCRPVLGQEVVQTIHSVGHGAPHCEQPQRIVVQLPPPQVEVRTKPSCESHCEPRRRLCIFGHRCKDDSRHHDRADRLGDVMYTPATLPTMLLPAPAAVPSTFTSTITHDFSALRQAHELDLRAAGLAAQIAARDAMRAAEDEWLKATLDRSESKFKALAGSLRTDAFAGPAATNDTLNKALQDINDRLDRIEELVMQHHQAIKSLREPGKKPE